MRATLHSAIILFRQNTRIYRGSICTAKFHILYFVALGEASQFDDNSVNDRNGRADNEQVDLYSSEA